MACRTFLLAGSECSASESLELRSWRLDFPCLSAVLAFLLRCESSGGYSGTFSICSAKDRICRGCFLPEKPLSPSHVLPLAWVTILELIEEAGSGGQAANQRSCYNQRLRDALRDWLRRSPGEIPRNCTARSLQKKQKRDGERKLTFSATRLPNRQGLTYNINKQSGGKTPSIS